MAQFVPEVVLVSIRINKGWAARCLKTEIRHNVRSIAQVQEVVQRHAHVAQSIGRDGFRGNRTDAAGNRQADSGTPIFTWKKDAREMVDVSHLPNDLTRLQFDLADAELLHKEGDRMSHLRLWYRRGDPMALVPPGLEGIIRELWGITWGHLHGFRNPDKSLTLNLAHMEDAKPMRKLRITPDWSVTCETISSTRSVVPV